jgi:hypothetical protein
MFFHHTKNKGDLGVLKVKVDLYLQGFLICSPETEHAPFDLVIYKNERFSRVQVKFRSLRKNGTLEIPFSSSYSSSKGVSIKKADKDQIDLYAVYCPQTDACYYFSPSAFQHTATLRVNAPRNNRSLRVHKAQDYREVP